MYRALQGLPCKHITLNTHRAVPVGMVTSGDMAFEYLSKRPDATWTAMGTKVLHITWAERGAIQLNDLNLEVRTYLGY